MLHFEPFGRAEQLGRATGLGGIEPHHGQPLLRHERGEREARASLRMLPLQLNLFASQSV